MLRGLLETGTEDGKLRRKQKGAATGGIGVEERKGANRKKGERKPKLLTSIEVNSEELRVLRMKREVEGGKEAKERSQIGKEEAEKGNDDLEVAINCGTKLLGKKRFRGAESGPIQPGLMVGPVQFVTRGGLGVN